MAVIEYDEYKQKLQALEPTLGELEKALGIPKAREELAELQKETEQEGFWNDLERSQQVSRQVKRLENKIKKHDKLVSEWEDTLTLCEMAQEEDDPSQLEEVVSGYETLEKEISERRLAALLSGEYDANNAILTFHAGAGVEGQNGVVGIVFAAEQRRQPALADLLLQRLVSADDLLQLAGVVLLLGHFAQGQGVLPLGNQLVVLLDLVLQALHLPAHLLAALQIVPEALLLRLLLQLGQLLTGLGDTQCLLQLAQSGLQRLQLLFILVVLDNGHISSLLVPVNFLSLTIIPKNSRL